jgi:hypothetical protein
LKSDVSVAKLPEREHVMELNRRILMKMADWVTFLHSFLELSNYPILQDKGKVSALEAKLKAEGEYEVYRQQQDANYISDFDREIRRIQGQERP